MASAMTSATVSVADGLVAFAILVGLQTVVAALDTFIPGSRRVITGSPALIAYDGELQRRVMRRERISEQDVEQALRADGYRDLRDVAAIVLETTGDLTIVGAGDRELAVLNGVER